MKLVLLGPSGAGKGTQAKNLVKELGLVHISTGDMLREQMKKRTSIGTSIEEIMDKGKLVSDDIVVNLVKQRIKLDDCKDGFILDGFPRTLYQAQILEDIVGEITGVVSITLDDDVIIKRMSGRYSCPDCGSVYHIEFYPPKKNGICDSCSSDLIQREDDKEATVKNRLKIYHEMTEPIQNFFREKGLLIEVDGYGDAASITQSIVEKLNKKVEL